jgi:septal ring factor EnvC (AmiA/AmiB activator)
MSLIKKKLTEEELQQIKDIKQQYTNLSLSLGEIELQKFQLLNTQSQLFENETKLVKQLTEKYGEGTINIQTGEIS